MTDYTEDLYRLGLLGQTIERITEDKTAYLSKMGMVESYYTTQKRLTENEKTDAETLKLFDTSSLTPNEPQEDPAPPTEDPAPPKEDPPPPQKTVVPILCDPFPDNRMNVLVRAFHLLHTEYIATLNTPDPDASFVADYLRLHTWVEKLT